jgi:hypothetical protein
MQVARDLAAVNTYDLPWWLSDLHNRAKAVSQQTDNTRERLEELLRVVRDEIEILSNHHEDCLRNFRDTVIEQRLAELNSLEHLARVNDALGVIHPSVSRVVSFHVESYYGGPFVTAYPRHELPNDYVFNLQVDIDTSELQQSGEPILQKMDKLHVVRRALEAALRPGVVEQVLDAFHGDSSWRA